MTKQINNQQTNEKKPKQISRWTNWWNRILPKISSNKKNNNNNKKMPIKANTFIWMTIVKRRNIRIHFDLLHQQQISNKKKCLDCKETPHVEECPYIHDIKNNG